MKSKLVFSLVIVLIIGFLFFSCDIGNTGRIAPNFEGSWSKGTYLYKFNVNEFEIIFDHVPESDEPIYVHEKGTFSFKGNVLNITKTHIWDGSKWITESYHPVNLIFLFIFDDIDTFTITANPDGKANPGYWGGTWKRLLD
ncbi:MAG: hypothetical protein FWG89_09870 [Treponema sp.]|nr:hypothetical protein [Treponema sp.]